MAKLTITWIVHAGFILDYEDRGVSVSIAIDPFLEPVSSEKDKWLEKLKNIDLLLITHSHFDHMGNACEILKLNDKIKCVGIFELANYIKDECKVANECIGMNIGGTWIFRKEALEIPITLVQSMHSSEKGMPTGFIIRYPNFTVYHAGDTGLHSDMTLFGRLYNVKLALLPIGGHFTMGIDEAIEAVRMLETKYVIPMHYNTFPIIQANPDEFRERVEKETMAKAIILKPGESYTFSI